MKKLRKDKIDWLTRIFFILVGLFLFQSNVYASSLCLINQGLNPNDPISETYTYDKTEDSIGAAVRLRRVLSKREIGLGCEDLLDESRVAARGVTGGAARMQKFGHLWQKASLDKAISRHAGSNPTSWVTKSGKTIFENSATGRQVVVDGAGYFRIFQPKSFGSAKGVYLDMMGKVPSPARFLKGGRVGNVPLTGGDLNQATHFLIR